MQPSKHVRHRPSWDAHWLAMCKTASHMSTCIRREVGCVLVSENNRAIATGFNGVPSGWAHCSELAHDDPLRCPADTNRGESSLGGCFAIHAE